MAETAQDIIDSSEITANEDGTECSQQEMDIRECLQRTKEALLLSETRLARAQKIACMGSWE